MFGRILISCFAALLFASNGGAFSLLPLDVTSVSTDATKGAMSQGFKLEYRTLLSAFLGEWLVALENAATELRAALSADDPNYAKYTVIIDGAKEQRGLLAGGGALNDDILAGILVKIKELWDQIHGLNPDRSKYQAHIDQAQKAINTLCQVVLEAWAHASALVGVIDTSKLDGYDALNADIAKSKGVPITADNVSVYNDLISRILQFFNVDAKLNYTNYV